MQYLVSIYFDDKTDKLFCKYMKEVADCCGNTYMPDHRVPPHITILAFEADEEESVIKSLEECVARLQSGQLQWVSVGAFSSGVLYLAPVLNEYLHRMMEEVYSSVKGLKDVRISPFYQPFQWLPHTTIAKKLTVRQMQEGFALLQPIFHRWEGKVVKIGLATKNPYQEICEWKL